MRVCARTGRADIDRVDVPGRADGDIVAHADVGQAGGRPGEHEHVLARTAAIDRCGTPGVDAEHARRRTVGQYRVARGDAHQIALRDAALATHTARNNVQ